MAKPWDECAFYVLEELKELNKKMDKIDKRLNGIQVKTAGIGGMIAVVVSIVFFLLSQGGGK